MSLPLRLVAARLYGTTHTFRNIGDIQSVIRITLLTRLRTS